MKNDTIWQIAFAIRVLQSGAHGTNHIVSCGHLSNLNSAQIRARADLDRDDRRSLLFVKINFVMTR